MIKRSEGSDVLAAIERTIRSAKKFTYFSLHSDYLSCSTFTHCISRRLYENNPRTLAFPNWLFRILRTISDDICRVRITVDSIQKGIR